MSECKTLEYHRIKQKEWYHQTHPNAPYRDYSKVVRDLNKLNGKVCLICQSSLKGRQLKYCSTCRDLPHCCKCGKLKKNGKILCDECREKGREENNADAPKRMAEYRKTPEYREWFNSNEQLPETKLRHCIANKKYRNSPMGIIYYQTRFLVLSHLERFNIGDVF